MELNHLNQRNAAATGWNLMKLIKKLKQKLLWRYFFPGKFHRISINQTIIVKNLPWYGVGRERLINTLKKIVDICNDKNLSSIIELVVVKP